MIPHQPDIRQRLSIALSDRPLALALMCYTAAIGAWLLWSGLRITGEDGYYYFAIAQHIARGAGVTFDGLHTTNGFHPLWLLCLIPLFWFTSAPDPALALGLLLQTFIAALGALLLYRSARLMLGRLAASLAVLSWLLLTYRWLWSGLEYALYALCLLALIYLYLRWFAHAQPRPALYLLLGILASLMFLARLDSVLLPIVLACIFLWREVGIGRTRMGVTRLFAFVAPVLIVACAYAALNLWWFGHPLPVSAAVKRDWSEYLLAHDPLNVAQGWWAAKIYQSLWPLLSLSDLQVATLAFGVFGAALLGLGARMLDRGSAFRKTTQTWQPFIVFSLANFLSYAWLLHGSLIQAPWYYVIQPILSVMLVAALLDALPKRPLRLAALLVVCLVVPPLTWRSMDAALQRQRAGESRDVQYLAAMWASANLPADAVIASWNAGTIGYLSGRRVINLDGLVNSWDYFENARGDLCAYWKQTGVSFLVDAFEEKQALSVVPTFGAYARCAGQLELIWTANPYNTSWHIEAYRINSATVLARVDDL